MSNARERRRKGRPSREAGGALRFLVGLWLVLQIAYLPIHLYLEPHWAGWGVNTGAGCAHGQTCAAGDVHGGDDHHDRHCAQQHEFKVTQPMRSLVAERTPVQAMEWVDPHEGCPHAQVAGFSGLSPPGFSCSWQFDFRAALPVRAPSLVS